MYGAAARIERFLTKHDAGPLTIVVGYASVQGLAWLSTRTRGRSVKVLIGDCQQRYFNKATVKDRTTAAAFLARSDVSVLSWDRRRGGPAQVHLKVWVVLSEPVPGVLVGSANLTGAGLFRNSETMAEPSDADRYGILTQVEALRAEATDVQGRIVGYLRGDCLPLPAPAGRAPDEALPPSPQPPTRRPPSAPGCAAWGGGCGLTVLGGTAAAVALAVDPAAWLVLYAALSVGNNPAQAAAWLSLAAAGSGRFAASGTSGLSRSYRPAPGP